MKTAFSHISILTLLIGLFINPVQAQTNLPEVLDEGSLEEQLEYLQERTRIYQDFRAIREDMFQKIKKNSLDSLAQARSEIVILDDQLRSYGVRIDSRQAELQATNVKLEEAIKNRDRMSFIGIPVNKTLYNSIMWIVIAGLVLLTVILFLTPSSIFYSSRTTDLDMLSHIFQLL